MVAIVSDILPSETKEIERKWIIQDPSASLTEQKFMYVEQAYISFDPTVRIRKMMDENHNMVRCIQTFKAPGNSLTRTEVEIEISESLYNVLISEFVDPAGIVQKKYYRVYLPDAYIYEISKVDDSWWYLEVEFDNEGEAKLFVLDKYITDAFSPIEVTEKKNSSIAAYSKAKIDAHKLGVKAKEYETWGVHLAGVSI